MAARTWGHGAGHPTGAPRGVPKSQLCCDPGILGKVLGCVRSGSFITSSLRACTREVGILVGLLSHGGKKTSKKGRGSFGALYQRPNPGDVQL